MKRFLLVMACVFGTAAIVLLSVSENGGIINIQCTVFCAACAVLSGVNLIGFLIVSRIERVEGAIRAFREKPVNQEIKETIRQLSAANPPAKPQPVPAKAPADQPKKAETGRNSRGKQDPEWIDDGEAFVRCPICGQRMSIDFIRARKKCPDCGREYNSQA